MPRVDETFGNQVYEIVAKIPKGKMMTYGQIAAFCGAAWAAWEVGQIAHCAPCANLATCMGRTDLSGVQGIGEQRNKPYIKYGERVAEPITQQSAKSINRVAGSARKQVNAICSAHDLPWQRVVNKQGGLARGYPGGLEAHKKALVNEGVEVNGDYKVDIKKLLWQPEFVDSSL